MSISGLCEICDQPPVEYTCDRCGKLVCDRHFDVELGVCVECVTQLKRGDSEPVGPSDTPDGVDTYRF